MSPLSRSAKLVVSTIVLLLVTASLTALGMVFSWIQVHSPGWRGRVALVLLLPYAAVNWIFASVFGHGTLPRPLYYFRFVLGSLGQIFYYFAIFTLMKRFVSGLRRRENNAP